MIDRACISLTDACNLRCRYCHFRDKQVAGSRMTEEVVVSWVERVNDYCHERGLESFKLGIVGSGEPLLEVDTILAMLETAEARQDNAIDFYTITNGTLATKEVLGRLRDHDGILSICFSLDGPRVVHEVGRSSFEIVMRGLANYRKVYGRVPAVNATVSRQTVEHAEEVIRFFLDEDLTEVTFSRLVDCDDADLATTREQFDAFIALARTSGLSSRQFRDEAKYDCTMYGRLCGVGRTNVFITAEGVYPCGRLYRSERYRLGGSESSFVEIEQACSRITPVEDGKCFFDERKSE